MLKRNTRLYRTRASQIRPFQKRPVQQSIRQRQLTQRASINFVRVRSQLVQRRRVNNQIRRVHPSTKRLTTTSRVNALGFNRPHFRRPHEKKMIGKPVKLSLSQPSNPPPLPTIPPPPPPPNHQFHLVPSTPSPQFCLVPSISFLPTATGPLPSANTSLNIAIHPSAYYYRNYMSAFLHKHFENVQIYDAKNVHKNTYIHCIIVYQAKLDEIQPLMKPYTKIVCISGEPHEIYLQFIHLLIDTKRDPLLRPMDVPFEYLPFYVQSFAERLAHPKELLLPPGFDRASAEAIMKQKTKFCAYMYANPVQYRDDFFRAMQRGYKSPDALGACCSNKTIAQTTRALYNPLVRTYYEDAIEQYQPYKFVIAIENSKINGYVTEKLMNPTLAHAVPIYLGAPDLFSDDVFNRKAIIHIADFKSYEDCVAHVKKVDQDPELYLAYLQEPLFTNNKLPKYFDSDYLLPAFLKMFNQ